MRCEIQKAGVIVTELIDENKKQLQLFEEENQNIRQL